MSDRKYRQRGYQDEGPRERKPEATPAQPKPREERVGPRRLNMPGFRQVVRCARCGNIITAAIEAESRCARCGADLHACAQCESFDAGSRFECSQPIPARITPKDARNACQLFSPRTTVERETGSTAPASARKAFDDLFK